MRCKRCFGPIEDANSDAGLYDDALYPDEEYDGTTTAASTDDEDDVTPTQTVLFCDQCVVERNANPPPLDVEALFSPTGPLSRPGFEVRPGQVKLARAIYEAAAHQHHLLAEGPCFTPDALVLADGAYRPIGECTVGMSIETLRGGSHIEAVKRRHYSGPAVALTTSAGFFPVTVTESHKFYVLRRERCVIPSRSNTLCGNACETACPIDVVKPHADRRMSGLPTVKPHTRYRIEVVEAKDLSEDDCLLVRQPREQMGKVVRENAYVELLGLWLAEGHVDGKNQETTRTCLTFSSTERETLAARALELGVELGFTGGIYDRPNNSVRVMIYGRKLAEQIVEDCGELSHAKRLPTWFACLSKQQQILLLTSLFKGDARVNLRPRVAGGTIAEHIRYVTVSLALATGVRDALHGLGVRCQAIREAARTDRNGVPHREAYRIQIPRRFMSLFGFRVETVRRDLKQIEHEENGEVYTLAPISKLTKTTYEGDVCNLTSAGHDSYLTDVGTSKNCGIGKSKAYGVPAAYLASHGKKVLIVTASIALQEQLIKKDLPALQQELADTFGDWSFAIMKGKSNYLCKESLAVADDNGLSADERDDFKRVMAWARSAPAPRTSAKATTTATTAATATSTISDDAQEKTPPPRAPRKSLPVFRGDKADLDFKPSDQVWSRFTTSSEACPGKKCPQFKECYATQARNAAANADVIVTNYHMLFLNISYGGTLLPQADIVMMDEAHSAADIARDLLGFRVSRATFSRYVRDARKRGATAEAMLLEQAADTMFSTLLKFYDSGHYAVMLRYPAPFPGLGEELLAAAKAYATACPKSHLIDHALAAATRVCEGLTLRDPNCVYSIEVSEPSNPQMQHRRTAALQARYVQPGPVLAEKLWAAHDSVIAASATITVANSFDYARRELGAPAPAHELAVDTPFNFQQQALLIVPTANTLTPEPNDPRFGEYVAQLLAATIEACNGRTLGLFTSYKGLRDAYQRITRIIAAWPAAKRPRILQQGDAPPGQLAETFKHDVHSVLLGTTSFWTGIDVPGEALTAVVIDKLPFGSPEDPVTMRLSETSRDTFGQHMVPRAILQFRQGVGRLIRAQSDVGVVVIVDKRVSTKGYGKQFIRSLPPMAKGVGTQSIAGFLERSKAKKGQAA